MDCDAFYATVELLRRPELVGKPVIVAGSGPRAVVTTASYEARRYGVGSAMPASRARRLCPDAVVIPPDFMAYRDKSRAVWDIVRERLESPMQQVSVDEAYADITEVQKPLRVLRELVAEVRERTGITISVGVGPSRLVAKTASDAEKPAGFVVLSREDACARFASRPARILQGVGPRTEERLREMGITTVGELQAAPAERLVDRFGGRMGRWLKRLAEFHDSSPVESSRVAKSRSSETTFDTDVDDLDELRATVRRLAAEVCEGLRRKETRGRTIGIKLRYDDWTNITRDRSIEAFTNDTQEVTAVALELFEHNQPVRPVRLVGVRVSSFEGVVAARPAAPEGLDGPGGQLMLPIPADRRADRRAERLASG
ncbi:MAG: polymerase [Solirubrobacteraceae bacterium]|jgi:DNA polymerase-4|nr:polymerase [Solirubrobacteraceae bacterium]